MCPRESHVALPFDHPNLVHQLGVALDAIHKRFSAAYGPAAGNTGWYAMDVEFKFDDDDAGRALPFSGSAGSSTKARRFSASFATSPAL